MTVVARRIPTPAYARIFETDGPPEAMEAFSGLLTTVLEQAHTRLQESFDDPDIFFLDDAGGFPLRREITGEYYVGDVSYEDAEEDFELWLNLRCLERTGRGPLSDRDYVGMEMIVYLGKATGQLNYEPHFQSSSI